MPSLVNTTCPRTHNVRAQALRSHQKQELHQVTKYVATGKEFNQS